LWQPGNVEAMPVAGRVTRAGLVLNEVPNKERQRDPGPPA